MKNTLFITAFAVFTLLTSCDKDKDEGKLPNIAFKTGGNYLSADASVKKDTTVIIGITASKAEDKDVLIKFDESGSFDTATALTSIYSENLTGASGDNYAKDISIHTRNVAGTEKYTFTVINKDGLKNSVTLKLTVN